MLDDQKLHARLTRGLERGELTLRFRAAVLLAPGSPAFGRRDAAFLAVVAALLTLAPTVIGEPGYSNTELAGVLLVAFVWGRWYWQRTKRRAVERALADPAGWEALWRGGAFELVVGRESCIAPTGDWRAFAARHGGEETEES